MIQTINSEYGCSRGLQVLVVGAEVGEQEMPTNLERSIIAVQNHDASSEKRMTGQARHEVPEGQPRMANPLLLDSSLCGVQTKISGPGTSIVLGTVQLRVRLPTKTRAVDTRCTCGCSLEQPFRELSRRVLV